MEPIRIDYGYQQQAREDLLWKQRGHTLGLGTQLKQGHRTAWWQAVEWVLNLQHGMDDLTQGQLLRELRKGNGSIYAPLLAADPTINAECPRCNQTVVIDREGICPQCTYEFQEID
jgi:aryl carrier-like protein